jgi:hypothetical protein
MWGKFAGASVWATPASQIPRRWVRGSGPPRSPTGNDSTDETNERTASGSGSRSPTVNSASDGPLEHHRLSEVSTVRASPRRLALRSNAFLIERRTRRKGGQQTSDFRTALRAHLDNETCQFAGTARDGSDGTRTRDGHSVATHGVAQEPRGGPTLRRHTGDRSLGRIMRR